MHPSKKAQIAHLKVEKVLIKVFSEYIKFADIFLPKVVIELPKHMEINNYVIQLVNNWQTLYSFINSLGFIKLERLKTYIKNNLIKSFIKPSKSPTKTPIYFDKKPNKSLRLYVNYCGLNNLTIKY